MNTQETILARRSCRKFTDEPISDEIIHTLLSSAMAGPSACNKRPWEFYIVKSIEMQEQIRQIAKYYNMNSSLMIIVAADEKRSVTGKNNDFWIQDCAAATENILLTATELGIGSCWCGLYPMVTPVKKLRKMFGLEDRITPIALIQLGYPAEKSDPRTQYDEKRVHYV